MAEIKLCLISMQNYYKLLYLMHTFHQRLTITVNSSKSEVILL